MEFESRNTNKVFAWQHSFANDIIQENIFIERTLKWLIIYVFLLSEFYIMVLVKTNKLHVWVPLVTEN
jgi:hypothetical protein